MKNWIGLVGALAGLALVIGGVIAYLLGGGLLGIGLLIGVGLSVIMSFLAMCNECHTCKKCVPTEKPATEEPERCA